MFARLTQFQSALDTIRRVTADIDGRAADAMADPNVAHALDTLKCATVVSLSRFLRVIPARYGGRLHNKH